MHLILISHPTPLPNEFKLIETLFAQGLDMLQVNKPNYSEKQLEEYIRQLPIRYKSKIFLHSEFLKFHSIEELNNYKGKFKLAFLSPIFNSISKSGYLSKYDLSKIKDSLKGKNIHALGGIDEDKIDLCREMRFVGVAVCGALWNSKDPVEKFKRLQALCQKTDPMF